MKILLNTFTIYIGEGRHASLSIKAQIRKDQKKKQKRVHCVCVCVKKCCLRLGQNLKKKLSRLKEGRLEWPPLNAALSSKLDLSSANLSIKGVTGPHISTTSTMSLNLGPHIEGK